MVNSKMYLSKTNYQQFYLKWLNRKRNIFCRKCKIVKALSIFETFKDCCQSKFQCEYRLANYFQFFESTCLCWMPPGEDLDIPSGKYRQRNC